MPYKFPLTSLTLIFLAWKCLLLLLTVAGPGPGYDTSSLILYTSNLPPKQRHPLFHSLGAIERLPLRLFRWDALYFVKAAQRGYVYEQEWAFSRTYSSFIGSLAPWFAHRAGTTLQSYIWAGVVTSTFCHYLSVLVLHRLVISVSNDGPDSRTPFVTAVLHILSPAGLFLSSPYTESLFSLLSFSGMLFYSLSKETPSVRCHTILQDCYMLASGILFAAATLIRGNGLLNGLVYLYDVALLLPAIFTFRLDLNLFRRITITSMAGIFVGIGFIGPQILGYRHFCVKSQYHQEVRPWCSDMLPSVYSWVQSNYWNVGFLRYWSLSNLPLFFLAVPMLWLLFQSSTAILQGHYDVDSKQGSSNDITYTKLPQLVLPQLVLATMAITNFHVQIINRVASGCPLWYIMIAKWLIDGDASRSTETLEPLTQWAIRWMVIYAIIQGILFSDFLPPA
ncbi:GPI mannosyltransferase 2 [Delitschia confertaspora ATCC 74209]|uniref:GPI mannosyltransferase 2 n=1 Tax=Delitschia confertaspora ATCC 74209 TaxID=1513339 RepID=A0A9P4JQZ7_9PLEO|nr:GPI mannosyltransferase 2 [Delitschia confertaspora ATCC 74209]